ncbi:MATE family efflux transporter [Phenylobacterium sp.]|uniref:MATE family efflux transporter n=1 Tax=Phenylobacterium sp. TaxID=1871053 RepID=UPI0011FF8018|nr:MATE family efflux transporter [Phenylobacterium sp.]THD62391.1 MAG: MATE family efflux transporter [Phenylobacterium sp.]
MARGPAAGSGPPGGRKGPDLTVGPIGKTLIAFALPVLGSNILQSLNATANMFWVGRVFGEAGVTATGNANQIFFMMLGAAFGITMAANILIGQAVGAKDEALARKIVGTATIFFAALSILVGVAGGILTPKILMAMRTPPAAQIYAIAYLRVIFGAMPAMFFFNFVMMAQRGAGDSRTPFYFALLQVGLDIVLNPLLLMGLGPFPKMGIAGSATSTLIAQSVTLAMMVIHLYRTRSILALRPSDWRLLIPDFQIIRTLLVKGTPMGIQMMVISLAAATMLSFVNRYGVHTSAAYNAASQLWTYVQMPAMALGAAVSSMAAQNVGARKMDRVERVAVIGSMYAVLFTGVPILILEALDPYVLQAFLRADSPSLPIAVHINMIALWGFIPFGVAFVLSGIVRATGAVWPPLLAMVISLWGVRVPLAKLLEPHLNADAIWLAFPAGSLTTLTLAGAYYFWNGWGGWRRARMLQVTPSADAPDTGLGQPMMDESEAITGEEQRELGLAEAAGG